MGGLQGLRGTHKQHKLLHHQVLGLGCLGKALGEYDLHT
jgi:hypothetical protein